MYFKIAFENVKKSFKDYTIYFLTLTFAVCIFYSFNSLSAQQVMFEANQYPAALMEMFTQMIGMVSIFVSMILGGLIVYGNNFLIKRRKKELGIYMSLGMAKSKISKILLLETLLIGMLALGVGLLLGVLGSQALSLFTAKLFEFDLRSYTFIFSREATFKTIAYFGVIFILVMLLNTRILSKYKLIDLLQAGRKSESMKVRSQKVSLGLFVTSMLVLGGAYIMIGKIGLDPENSLFWVVIILGCLGTFLYFLSITGFVMAIFQKNKGIYLRQLNPFILRQLSSKAHTNVASMTAICLLLFLTITGLSTGLSFKAVLEKGLETTTPYDASITTYQEMSIEESLKTLGVTFEGSEDYAIYKEYKTNLELEDLREGIDTGREFDTPIGAISLSDYNEMNSLAGREPIVLEEDEVVFTSNNTILIPSIQSLMDQGIKIPLNGKDYSVKNDKLITQSFETSGFSNNLCTIIVPDQAIVNLTTTVEVMNINYGEANRADSEEKFATVFDSYREGVYKGQPINYEEQGFLIGYTREQIYVSNQGMKTTILFIGIYLGMIFLISSAAVLALQQLTEASDSIERYESLKKIGASKKMISKVIRTQVIIYFMLPLSLALVHSVVGIVVANDFIAMFNKPDIGISSLITAVMLSIVYGGYCYTTYMGYKNIVNHKR